MTADQVPLPALKQQAMVMTATAIYLAGDTPEGRRAPRLIAPGVVEHRQRAVEEGRARPRSIPGWAWICSNSARLLVCRSSWVGSTMVGEVTYRAGHGWSTSIATVRRSPNVRSGR